MSCRRIAPVLVIIISFILSFFTSYAKAVDFSVMPLTNTQDIAVYEVAGNYDARLPDGSINTVPRQEVAKEFYKAHPDDYDFLVIFSNFDLQMLDNEDAAFYLVVKNDVRGIGKELIDTTSLYGTDGVLQGVIDMGNINSLSTDPLPWAAPRAARSSQARQPATDISANSA